MIEKDNIQELFSKAFENQTTPVRPDLWAGVQAKMAAAGVASTATVATKGLSALTKWIIGSAAVGTVGVVTAVVALNSGEEQTTKQTDSPKEISQNMTVTSPEEKSTEEKTRHPHTIYTKPVLVSDQEITPGTNPYNKENKSTVDLEEGQPVIAETVREDKGKSEEKSSQAADSKHNVAETKEHKEPKKQTGSSESKGGESTTHNTPETKESINPEKAGKVTNFTNIFSPDGDYVNDKYLVKVENLVEFKMTITDQNNRMLFQTSDQNEGWDGKVGGDDAKPGSYAVFIDGRDLNGKEFHKAQIIQLVR